MKTFRFLLLTGLGVLSACVPAVVRRRAPTPAPTAAPSAVRLNTTGPWRLGARPLSQKVAITTQAVVVIRGDTVVRTDTLQATLGASYTWTAAQGRKVDGTLTDYRVSVGAATPAVPAGLSLGRAFSAESGVPKGELVFRLPSEASACTDPMLSVLQGMHEAWIPLPDTLVVGREWSDTVHTLSCRDRIPLRGTNVRRFRVVRGDVVDGSRVVVTIDRVSRGRLAGEGDQFGEHVSLAGESSGTLRYVLDPVTGSLVRATGTASLAMTLTSSRRKQQVRQESQLTLAWAP